MKNYLDLLSHVLTHGVKKTSRGVVKDTTDAAATRSVFAPQLRFNLQEGFPLVTTKKIAWASVVHELLWFISGSTNIKYLHENNVHIWDSWVDKNGDLGPVYGKQWRFCNAADKYDVGDGGTIDQLAQVIDGLKKNPDGRRHIVSAWNVADLPAMRLPPCHALFQFYVAPEPVDTVEVHPGEYTTVSHDQAIRSWAPARPRLSCQLYQRSADLFLGVPFNIASYALLTHMVAQVCGFDVGEFVLTFGDAHIYENHIDAVSTQLGRAPYELPRLRLDPTIKNIDDFRFEHIRLEGYSPQAAIKATVVV